MNPDFGQVEADPSVVNLTAYETFYEEKRPFFLEGRKILRFEIEDEDQLFYSRRIGAPPSRGPFLAPGEETSLPDSTTILGAFKVTGKTDGGTVGRRPPGVHPEGDGLRDVAGRPARRGRRAVRQLHGRPPPQGLGQGQHEPRRDGDLDPPVGGRPRPRLPADPGDHRRGRLHALLRRPRLGPRGERRREPRPGRPRGHPGPPAERGPLLPAARRDPPRRRPRPHLPHRPRRDRCASAAPTPAGCASSTTSTGTRRGSTSTTSATCGRPT